MRMLLGTYVPKDGPSTRPNREIRPLPEKHRVLKFAAMKTVLVLVLCRAGNCCRHGSTAAGRVMWHMTKHTHIDPNWRGRRPPPGRARKRGGEWRKATGPSGPMGACVSIILGLLGCLPPPPACRVPWRPISNSPIPMGLQGRGLRESLCM